MKLPSCNKPYLQGEWRLDDFQTRVIVTCIPSSVPIFLARNFSYTFCWILKILPVFLLWYEDVHVVLDVWSCHLSQWWRYGSFRLPLHKRSCAQESKQKVTKLVSRVNTVDSRYLEFQGTVLNTSRYPYFDISDLQNWGKTNSINHI